MLDGNGDKGRGLRDELGNVDKIGIEILSKGISDFGTAARIAVEAAGGEVGKCGCIDDCSCDVNCSGCVSSC